MTPTRPICYWLSPGQARIDTPLHNAAHRFTTQHNTTLTQTDHNKLVAVVNHRSPTNTFYRNGNYIVNVAGTSAG